MVGFILYDFDKDIPVFSMSRFMIGEQYQGKGYGKGVVSINILQTWDIKNKSKKISCLEFVIIKI